LKKPGGRPSNASKLNKQKVNIKMRLLTNAFRPGWGCSSITVALVILSGAPASATNFYVDNAVSTSGNGTSWSSAWKNFSNISWSYIKPGDTIYVSGGSSSQSYYETLTIGASGSSGYPITITKGVDSGHNGQVILDEQNARPNGVYSNSKNYVTIQNLNVQNITDAGIAVKYATSGVLIQSNSVYSGLGAGGNARGYDIRNSSGVTVLNNKYSTPSNTSSQTDGIWSSGNKGVVFKGNSLVISNSNNTPHNDCIQSYTDYNIIGDSNYCQIADASNNHGYWITSIQHGGSVLLKNNIAVITQNTRGIGYEFRDAGDDGAFYAYNNTVYGGGRPSIELSCVSNCPSNISAYFKNNIVYQSSSSNQAFWLQGSVIAAANISNNLVFLPNGGYVAYLDSAYGGNSGNKTWVQWQSLGFDKNGINADPQFTNVSGKQFMPKSTSPAIDHGTTLSEVKTDKNGTARPQGSAYDMGSYEFIP
jgi:hypothetical protein